MPAVVVLISRDLGRWVKWPGMLRVPEEHRRRLARRLQMLSGFMTCSAMFGSGVGISMIQKCMASTVSSKEAVGLMRRGDVLSPIGGEATRLSELMIWGFVLQGL